MTQKFKGILLSVLLVVIALLLLPIVVDGVLAANTERATETDNGMAVTNGTLTNGTGTFTGSPIALVSGANTVACTVAGTAIVVLPAGMTGTVATGTMTVTGSPVTLAAGNNTITTEGAIGNITVTMAGGGDASIVLTTDLYSNGAESLIECDSATPGSTPVFVSYTPGTNTLLVRGCGSTTPQNFTTTYRIDATADYAGVQAMTNLMPLLVVVGLVVVAIINGFWSLKAN